MAKGREYNHPVDFQRALEDRLANLARQEGLSLQRLRRHVVFERLLSRFFTLKPPPCILKGGYSMELLTWNYGGKFAAPASPLSDGKIDLALRLKSLSDARTTRDIDLDLVSENLGLGSAEEDVSKVINKVLLAAISVNMNDFFVFKVANSTAVAHPPTGGVSFLLEAILADKLFSHVRVDIGAGGVEIPPNEKLASPSLLWFSQIDCPAFLTMRREQQFAEKVHAYTTLRAGKMGSRVKDLFDMALILKTLEVDRVILALALRLVFDHQNTHALPVTLPFPPHHWREKFVALAVDCRLGLSMGDAFKQVNDFYTNLPLATRY